MSSSPGQDQVRVTTAAAALMPVAARAGDGPARLPVAPASEAEAVKELSASATMPAAAAPRELSASAPASAIVPAAAAGKERSAFTIVPAAAAGEELSAAAAAAPHSATITTGPLPRGHCAGSGNAAETFTAFEIRALQLWGAGREDAGAVGIAELGTKRQRSSIHTSSSPAAADDSKRGRAEYDADGFASGIEHHSEVVEIE